MTQGIVRPIFLGNAGLWVRGGVPIAFGVLCPAPADATLVTGAWVYLLALAAGLAILVLTHVAARRWIGWLRRARAGRPWTTAT